MVATTPRFEMFTSDALLRQQENQSGIWGQTFISQVRTRDFDDAEQARKRQKKQEKKQLKLELEKRYATSGMS